MAGKAALDETSAAYSLHFRPEELKFFNLVYQNSYYRVYRVADLSGGNQKDGAGPEKVETTYTDGLQAGLEQNRNLFYNEDLFKKWGVSTSMFACRINLAHRYYLKGLILESYGYMEQARDFYKKSLGVAPEFDLAKQKLQRI
ncbi:MAG: hypothetical protein KAX15_00150 [Candidatus Omnitrophica bacterium]|nr:hypothetical protein [Candidatus Omnitrophota bacterium]